MDFEENRKHEAAMMKLTVRKKRRAQMEAGSLKYEK